MQEGCWGCRRDAEGAGGMPRMREGCCGCRRDAEDAGGIPGMQEGCWGCGMPLSTKLWLHVSGVLALEALGGAARREGFQI